MCSLVCELVLTRLHAELASKWHDVQSCAADPGAVRSSIWKRAGPIMQWVANHVFAPNEDGCQTVVHAATAAWTPAEEAASAANQTASLRVSHTVWTSVALTGCRLTCFPAHQLYSISWCAQQHMSCNASGCKRVIVESCVACHITKTPLHAAMLQKQTPIATQQRLGAIFT